MSVKKRTASLIAEIDPVELGVALFEAIVGMKRPIGLTAEQAFGQLPIDDQNRVLRASHVAVTMIRDAINSGGAPS